MKLIVITPSKDFTDEPMLVTRMFESGLTTLHLRKPNYSTAQMRDYINEIPEHYHNRIIIHSHHSLAIKFKLKGIHLSRIHFSKKLRYLFVRFRLKMKFGHTSKSRSYTKLQQAYNKEEHSFDYYLIGTMFNNMNGDLYSGFYPEGIIAANKTCGKKLVARGGATPKIIQKAREYGFYGIAFNSYLWSSDSPYDNFLVLVKEYHRLGMSLEWGLFCLQFSTLDLARSWPLRH